MLLACSIYHKSFMNYRFCSLKDGTYIGLLSQLLLFLINISKTIKFLNNSRIAESPKIDAVSISDPHLVT
jgi:hypothetical protein